MNDYSVEIPCRVCGSSIVAHRVNPLFSDRPYPETEGHYYEPERTVSPPTVQD
jgi:deoxycytidylate deaminase